MAARLLEKYRKEVIPQIQEKFKIANPMAVSHLSKIVVNMGVGEAIGDAKLLDRAAEHLALITGQKPVVCRSKKAISNFKLREDLPIGCKVTLRRTRMYEFFDRLVNVSIPRIRDFNGTSRKAFDRDGNYTLGIADQGIFPEIDIGARDHRVQGMDISFVFEGGNKEQNFEVLRLLGMPFTKQ
ncbi:MAG: 50S ribosomal protein L5 [Candidatus Omnitrophica bacterium]|nr:50S ribosomal protein L5 [Candidatus Omnitrophota bacterium]MDE2008511.1 50S ribosomal protein L5 [Candidatus Omnitrophota bacterium]MDE2213977.1 50S ribosomal protein L5 [Candidatus Omnitrophota bacterium]MDE2231368.1 50S ribosomal protein L5 [Candidatus Omnitrophota bacterium]